MAFTHTKTDQKYTVILLNLLKHVCMYIHTYCIEHTQDRNTNKIYIAALCDPVCMFGECTSPNVCECNTGFNGYSCDESEIGPLSFCIVIL